MKIEQLTKAQEEALPVYCQEGIDIGLATGPDFDEKLVQEITDQHRIACGIKKAKNFLIYDSPFAAMTAHPDLTTSSALYGQHDINWLQYFKYMDVELGVTGMEKYRPLYQLATRVGWLWMGNNTTIITRRPSEIHLITKPLEDGNSLKVLHNYIGMSLKYRDGEGIYTINGTPIPSSLGHLVHTSAEDLDVRSILEIKNTEVRTEFLKKIGIEKAFDSLNKQLLDTKTLDIGGKYELFSVELGETTRIYLRGECPSNKEAFFEAVPPSCRSVEDGLNFRNFGTMEVPFQLPLELT